MSGPKESINESIENIARWHIAGIERGKGGTVTRVKHIQFGWISIKEYYKLQKLHELTPILIKAVEGGYRLKAQLWAVPVSLDIVGSGITVPFGAALITAATTLSAIDAFLGNELYAALDLWALVLPFGEIWIMWRGEQLLWGAANSALDYLKNLPGWAAGTIPALVGGGAEGLNQAVSNALTNVWGTGIAAPYIPPFLQGGKPSQTPPDTSQIGPGENVVYTMPRDVPSPWGTTDVTGIDKNNYVLLTRTSDNFQVYVRLDWVPFYLMNGWTGSTLAVPQKADGTCPTGYTKMTRPDSPYHSHDPSAYCIIDSEVQFLIDIRAYAKS